MRRPTHDGLLPSSILHRARTNLCGNGHLHLNTGLDVDDDLLDDLSGCVQVDETLVDSAVCISNGFPVSRTL